MCLSNGITLVAHYFPYSCLPLLKILDGIVHRNFWLDSFAYTNTEACTLGQSHFLWSSNQNLSALQKEVFLWHYCLCHASFSLIQLLMCNYKWLWTHAPTGSLHKWPFIPCKATCGYVCNVSCIKYILCQAFIISANNSPNC